MSDDDLLRVRGPRRRKTKDDVRRENEGARETATERPGTRRAARPAARSATTTPPTSRRGGRERGSGRPRSWWARPWSRLPEIGGRRWPAALLVVLVLGAGTATAVELLGGEPSGTDAAPSADEREEQRAEPRPADLVGVQADAQDMLLAWARPDVAYGRWWSELSPLLSPAARVAYEGTDPAGLPALEVDGEVELQDGPSRDTATVFFETTEGRFGVDVSRQGSEAPWRMVRILFPGQESTL